MTATTVACLPLSRNHAMKRTCNKELEKGLRKLVTAGGWSEAVSGYVDVISW